MTGVSTRSGYGSLVCIGFNIWRCTVSIDFSVFYWLGRFREIHTNAQRSLGFGRLPSINTHVFQRTIHTNRLVPMLHGLRRGSIDFITRVLVTPPCLPGRFHNFLQFKVSLASYAFSALSCLFVFPGSKVYSTWRPRMRRQVVPIARLGHCKYLRPKCFGWFWPFTCYAVYWLRGDDIGKSLLGGEYKFAPVKIYPGTYQRCWSS